MTRFLPTALFWILCCSANLSADSSVVWQLDNLEAIGGYPVRVVGDPAIIETPEGRAIEFDGVDDGIFLDVHPLEGLESFTVEIVFKPYSGGAPEQRFFHMQEDASDSRVMFETRLTEDDHWFLDTFIKSGEQGVTHYASDFLHETDRWQHAAIVVDGARFSHYVNGKLERQEALRYEAQGPGKTSLGVRLNEVHWFRGAIRTVRFTPGVLEPFEFIALEQDSAGPPVTIPGTETRSLHSNIVGQDYSLQVSLPRGYGESDRRYPVVYLLDAQWDFPLVHAIYGEQYYDGFLPELILVGLTWGGDNPDHDRLRLRDFTPTDESGDGSSGGAGAFLSFFEKELIPFVDSHYPTSGQRTLAGSSLGGLLTLYALFNRPDLFNNYLATAPATPWDGGALFRYEAGFGARSAQNPSRLYLAVGELEGLHAPVMDLIARLRQENYPGLVWTSHVVAGAGHSGMKAEGYTRGLQYAFERPDLALSEEEMAPYLGSYRSTEGPMVVEIGTRNGRLIARMPATGEEWLMSAQDRTNFYHRGSFLKARFLLDDTGRATGFLVQTYASTGEFRRE